jgi:alpha-glucosidase (family GH31 glycosyl hydrolase)
VGLFIAVATLASCSTSIRSAEPSTSVDSAERGAGAVDLSAHIDLALGRAATADTIVEGDARFEMLSPELIRLEYSPTGQFLDTPTFNVLDRDFGTTSYTTTVSKGWIELHTSQITLSYRLGSGPFNATNTKLQMDSKPESGVTSVDPTWEWECTYGQECQSGAATLTGSATIATNHADYASPSGFVAGFSAPGAAATWHVLGAPPGSAQVEIRYSNALGSLGGPAPRTISLVVNGTTTQLTLQPTQSWNDWATITERVTLQPGENTVALSCGSSDGCNVNIDEVAVTAPSESGVAVLPVGHLGGYIRSFDDATYGSAPKCSSGETGASCVATLPAEAQGLLDKSGWFLLDDTHTAVWTQSGWIAPRPTGDVEDGYVFGYGSDYSEALGDLAKLTGSASLLPEYIFGNWFSDYYPYSASDYEDSLLPEFAANGVSLDDLTISTDWKSPNAWDGWEWNSSLFPHPSAFLAWAAAKGIHVTLNVHPSIATDDPLYSQTQSEAEGNLATVHCSDGQLYDGLCAVFDWSQFNQAEAYFELQQPLQAEGADFPLLDWCCDDSNVSVSGVTPDAWINHLYAQEMVNAGERGFVLSRIGASEQDQDPASFETGWAADHRSAIHFTADTWSTWNTLAFEAELTQDEGSIGEPYVSDDIGGYLGPPPGGASEPDDLYLRWLQLGTFQPIMRLHSKAGNRLPWDYDASTRAIGDQFLQLRESLVPYLYTLSEQAVTTGMPMAQALYLDYPTLVPSYEHPTEYMLGSSMLVAPVTTPGDDATTTVWFPPGRWVDWFTGATFTGPSTARISVPLDREAVFVRGGGIVPLQPASGHAAGAGSAPLTLRVFSGASGFYDLYEDAGTGLGYEHGQFSLTPIVYSQASSSAGVLVEPSRGTYPAAPNTRTWTVDFVDVTKPSAVLVNRTTAPKSDWTYSSATQTLQVHLPPITISRPVTVTEMGGKSIARAEPT